MRVATVAVGLSLTLAACGSEPARGPTSGSAARPPDNAANPSRPWEVRSEAGLWRVGNASVSRLSCHGSGSLIPTSAGCGAPSYRQAPDGFVRERRCEGRPAERLTITGDLASGFSVTDADGATTTYLRMDACPSGWRAGETRGEGILAERGPDEASTPAPAPRPRRAPPPPDAIDDALDGTYDGAPPDPAPITPPPAPPPTLPASDAPQG